MSLNQELYALLKELDHEFQPSLSSIVDLHEYAEKLVSNATIFTCYEKSVLVGFIAMYCNDPEGKMAYLSMICVAQGHRGKGLAPNLIQSACNYLKRLHFERFRLEVFKTNDTALAVYTKLGFKIYQETERSSFLELNLLNH